jgi:anaerobic magnesium-protoporphyrin IX monomethyl ester cyclase
MSEPVDLSIRSAKRTVWKKPSEFKVLLVYPNIQQSAMMPYSMGLFTALLHQQGYDVQLFDSSFYVEELTSVNVHYRSFVKQFDWLDRDVRFHRTAMREDFCAQVERFQPDLIAVSVVENTYAIGRAMIRALPARDRDIPVIWGGPFATFAPQIILGDHVGDIVCRGEGENALVEVCRRMCDGVSISDVPNLWVRDADGTLHRNAFGPQVDLATLPFADYSLFEPQAIYRPMEGKIWRTIGIESQRGCPYQCTYCNSPSNNRMSQEELGTKFYRRKPLDRVMAEIEHQNREHGIELVYWLADTFLAMPSKDFDELVERYEDYRIPFWMNTRSETITEHTADGLERMNMLRASIGIEHGNADYRRKYLKRLQTNEQLINAFKICSGRSFNVTGNCIIGMPDEDRDLVFDTIKLIKCLPDDIDTHGCFIFAPFHGTELRRIAESRGYVRPHTFCDIADLENSILDQPQLSRSDVIGIAKTYGLYQTAPESEWNWVRKAEANTPEADQIFDRLMETYRPQDMGSTVPGYD